MHLAPKRNFSVSNILECASHYIIFVFKMRHVPGVPVERRKKNIFLFVGLYGVCVCGGGEVVMVRLGQLFALDIHNFKGAL